MNKKAMLANLLEYTSILSFFRRYGSHDGLLILAYHRVLDLGNEFEFDKDLVSASQSEFKWQVDHIKKHYNPITFKQLFEIMDRNEPVPRRSVIMTFDDGFDDNYFNAYRILKEAGVPGTFFVCSDYIGQVETFWFDRVVYLLRQLPVGHYSFDDERLCFNIGNGGESEESEVAISKFLRHLKDVQNNRRLEIIADLEATANIKLPKEGLDASRPMTWNQVREMSDNGMEIGSHTCSHPILSRLSSEELRREIYNSKKKIEEKISCDINVLAYPVGGREAFNEEAVLLARSAGYRAACSYISGRNEIGNVNWYQLRRLHVEYYVDRNYFSAMLAISKIFA